MSVHDTSENGGWIDTEHLDGPEDPPELVVYVQHGRIMVQEKDPESSVWISTDELAYLEDER